MPEKVTKENISSYILYFFLYSSFGWIYEVVLETFIYHWGFHPKRFFCGPYCPIYGVGAVLFLLVIYPMIREKTLRERVKYIVPVFLACMALATAVELIGSYVCEWLTGTWAWTSYATSYRINFQGRIALSPSLRFGLGGILFLYILQPIFERLPKKAALWMSRCYVLMFFIDCLYTFLLS